MKQKLVVLPDQPESEKGSSKPGEPQFLVVGKFRRPHGLYGEIAMEIFTDFPERLIKGKYIYIGENHDPLIILKVRSHQDLMLLYFEGLDQREKVNFLTNQLAYVITSDLPNLPEGYFYHHQMIGLTVKDNLGTVLGKLEEILKTGANDVFVIIKADGKELLIPAIESVLLDVDLEKRELIVVPQVWE
jgi:16S rRNA processing protein RimM